MRVRSLCLIVVLIAAGPGHAAAQTESRAPSSMRESALVVGNVLFAGNDGVLRYDGQGHFIDAMVPDPTDQIITCCITFGPDDNLYVSNPAGGNVLRVNGLTGAIIGEFVASGAGGLQVPLILLFHGGYLYVGDTGAGAVRRYDARTGAYVDDFLPDGTQGMTPFDLQQFVFAADGRFYVAAGTQGRIMRFDGPTGAYIDDLVPAGTGFVPSGLTLGPDGLLYVDSFGRSEVRRYNPWTSRMVDVFVTPGSGGLNGPVGLTFGPDGNLYVTSVNNPAILRYDGRTGHFKDVFVPGGRGGLDGPRTIAFKTSVTICHVAPGNPRIRRSLTIGYLSGLDHVKHGDTIGACR